MDEQLWADAVEEKIRQAMDQGEFDDLPHTGRRLDLDDTDDGWWARRKMEEMRRHDQLIAEARQIGAEIDRLWTLPDESRVRARVEGLNRRVDEINQILPAGEQVDHIDPVEAVRTWHRMYRLRS
ncbi:MAG TPA: DnaJ family domain-containing protein [Acidimicrobiia bacterium]|nr:DnaJ family domain-containing protein [Acidimicrobiia bacterium]